MIEKSQHDQLVTLQDAIKGWYLWLPEGLRLDEISYLEDAASAMRPDLNMIPVKFRRRLSHLSAISLHVAQKTVAPFIEGNQVFPSIFASRHGESDTTISLFEELFRKEILSPLSFSRSVHNTGSGLHSIATENRQAQTALSGGSKTAQMAILEGLMQAYFFDSPVLIVLADEQLATEYRDYVDECSVAYGLGILLKPICPSQVDVNFSFVAAHPGIPDGVALARHLRNVAPAVEIAGVN
jgi:hypothetical protein